MAGVGWHERRAGRMQCKVREEQPHMMAQWGELALNVHGVGDPLPSMPFVTVNEPTLSTSLSSTRTSLLRICLSLRTGVSVGVCAVVLLRLGWLGFEVDAVGQGDDQSEGEKLVEHCVR